MKAFWDTRYEQADYAYGTQPNVFFAKALASYQPQGTILLPAEGEGRNGVYAAEMGLETYAYDISKAGRKKALNLAAERGVSLEYYLSDSPTGQVAERQYDALGLIYAHFPPHLRVDYHRQLEALLHPGGLVVLEGFSINNLPYREKNPQVGGPDRKEMLFTTTQIEEEFAHCEPLLLEEQTVELSEGKYHIGTAVVVRFVGRKRG